MLTRRHFLVSCPLLAPWMAAHAQGASAADPQLVTELQRLYSAWKTAMARRDLTAWARYTSRARQMMVRNSIVSQRREWPRSLFSLAMMPPEIRGLKLAGSQQLGAQARLVYYGRIDFELDDPRVPPDAILVLDFVHDPDGWKFFASRYFNFRDYPQEAALVAQGNLSFLDQPETRLTGQAPPVPPPCPQPQYVGQIYVASFGYTTRLQLGEYHRDLISGRATTEIISGGLRRGTTPLAVTVAPLAQVAEADRLLEISIFVQTSHLQTKSARVFHWKPQPPVPEVSRHSVIVGPSTMHEGNETPPRSR